MFEVQIKLKKFNELNNHELYEILRLRSEIFVVEQNCVYLDLDDLDQQAFHLFAKENNQIIAYVRLLKPGQRFPEASIGRVVTKKDNRNRGISTTLLKKAIGVITNEWQYPKITLSAQMYLQKFYENLGFVVVSDEYLEDGIPHIEMERKS